MGPYVFRGEVWGAVTPPSPISPVTVTSYSAAPVSTLLLEPGTLVLNSDHLHFLFFLSGIGYLSI